MTDTSHMPQEIPDFGRSRICFLKTGGMVFLAKNHKAVINSSLLICWYYLDDLRNLLDVWEKEQPIPTLENILQETI